MDGWGLCVERFGRGWSGANARPSKKVLTCVHRKGEREGERAGAAMASGERNRSKRKNKRNKESKHANENEEKKNQRPSRHNHSFFFPAVVVVLSAVVFLVAQRPVPLCVFCFGARVVPRSVLCNLWVPSLRMQFGRFCPSLSSLSFIVALLCFSACLDLPFAFWPQGARAHGGPGKGGNAEAHTGAHGRGLGFTSPFPSLCPKPPRRSPTLSRSFIGESAPSPPRRRALGRAHSSFPFSSLQYTSPHLRAPLFAPGGGCGIYHACRPFIHLLASRLVVCALARRGASEEGGGARRRLRLHLCRSAHANAVAPTHLNPAST